MNIFDHIIADDEVKGIGPLRHDEDATWDDAGYYWFAVHLRHHSIAIKSDLLSLSALRAEGPNDTKAVRDAFKHRYEETRVKVAELIGEDIRG